MATDCWRKMLPILKQAGHLAAIDASVLEEWCICRARIAECERDIAKNGLTADGERGSVKNPATTIAGQYRTRLKVCEEQLGIGSMNRLRLPPPPPPKDDDSDLEGTPD
jgi:P27 family predicted phage terminase small subunit